MKLIRFEKQQLVKTDIEQAWQFFSNPANLSVITPPEMDFQIQSPLTDEMYPGMIIQYTVKPFSFMKVHWVTEITQVKKPEFFIDEQRFGPYKFWHHQHFFDETSDGLLCKDIIHYGLPLGFLGRSLGSGNVNSQLEKIFDFRRIAIEKQFGS